MKLQHSKYFVFSTLATALLFSPVFEVSASPAPQKKSNTASGTSMAPPSPSPSQFPGPQINRHSLELNEQGVVAVQARNFKLAEDFFLKALGADQHNLTATYNLAGMYLTNKKIRQAQDLLQEYVSKGVADPGIYFRLGDAYFADKKVNEALKNYEKTRALDPNYPQLATRLGTVYSLSNRVEEAEKMFLKAVESNPKDGASLSSLSSLFLANKKPQEAVRTAKRAIQVRPTSDVYVTLGAAYEQLKDYKNSLIAYERAADLDASRKDIREKIELLKQRSA